MCFCNVIWIVAFLKDLCRQKHSRHLIGMRPSSLNFNESDQCMHELRSSAGHSQRLALALCEQGLLSGNAHEAKEEPILISHRALMHPAGVMLSSSSRTLRWHDRRLSMRKI